MFIISTYNSHVWGCISFQRQIFNLPWMVDFLILLYNWNLLIHIVPLDLDKISSLKANKWMTASLSSVLHCSKSVSAITLSLWLLLRTVTWTLTSNPIIILACFLLLHCEWVKNVLYAFPSDMAPVSHQETIAGHRSWGCCPWKARKGVWLHRLLWYPQGLII